MSKECKKSLFKENKIISCRPFVKWVGGKSQLLPELLSRIPENYGSYFEPFVGGGALFFALQPEKAFLSDVNAELINSYRIVKSNVNKLINELENHIYEKDYYYKIRHIDRESIYKTWSNIEKAARIIYLNKTCFNGLYRVNSKGEFNTPFGKYSNPKIVDAPNLKACSKALKGVELKKSSFVDVLDKAEKGDFVYFDPPYVPVSDTAYFTSYNENGFGPNEQKLLRDVCVELDKKGVYFLASNSSADFVKKLYSNFKIDIIKASRSINSKGSKRGKVEEVIIRNF
jgi:DNA adenine methylase